MHLLQSYVGPILRIPQAIVVQARDFGTKMFSDSIIDTGVLIDVVTQMNHQVVVILLHVWVAIEEAGFPVLAGSEGKLQPFGHDVSFGCGSSPSHRTHFTAGVEPVKVPPFRLQPLDLDVNRMSQLWNRECRTPLDNIGKRLIC